MANERVVDPDTTIKILREELRRLIRQRALLAESIREIAASVHAIDPDASLTGPELLHVAKEISTTLASRSLDASDDDRSAGLRAWMEDDDLSTPHARLRFSPRRREAVESALRAYAESGVDGAEAEALRARLAEVERELRTERTEAAVARSERGDAKTESARLLAALRTWAFDWDGKRWVCRDCGRSLYRTGERTVDDMEHEADCGLAAALDSERWRTRREPTAAREDQT